MSSSQFNLRSCLVSIAGCCLLAPAFAAQADGALSPAVLKMLAQVRQATASYHDRRKAEADGYQDIDFCISGMGCHYLNVSLLDGVFDPNQPEALVYAPDAKTGRMKLVAVEYLVPCGGSCDGIPPPAGFPGDYDGWAVVGELWTLHAWIWLPNPHGMFASHNPRLY